MKIVPTLKAIAAIPGLLNDDNELNEERYFVQVQFNDREHYSRKRMKSYAQWHTLMFVVEADEITEEGGAAHNEQTAYAKGFGSTISCTDKDDVTWRVYKIMDDELCDTIKQLSNMLRRSRGPEGMIGAVADTYPYVKAELLAKAEEAIK